MHCRGRGRFSLPLSKHTPRERGRGRERNEGEGGRDNKRVKRGGMEGQNDTEIKKASDPNVNTIHNKKKISSFLWKSKAQDKGTEK